MTDTPAPDWEAFGRDILAHSDCEWYDLEGSEIFDMAEKHHLIRPVPGGFNPESHIDPGLDLEPGDPWFTLNYFPET